VAAVGLSLAACSAAQDAANGATGAAKAKATQEASKAAVAAVKDQICRIAGDGNLSASDLATLKGLLGQAQQLGIPRDVTDPVAAALSKGSASADQVKAIQATCP
jgi:hypothetical protein